MALFRNPITEAIGRKRRAYYPPDQLANGPDRLLRPVASLAPMAALNAQWAAVLSTSIPAVDPLTNSVETGYYEELPWDE